MKTNNTITTLLAIAALAIAPHVTAAEKDHKPGEEHADHDHDKDENQKGPNGGILVHAVEPHFEFTVTKDRKAKITFLDDDDKVIAPEKQVITATGGDRSNPTRLTFAKGGGGDAKALISDKPLPEGEHVDIVLQIKTAPDAKAVTARITLHLHDH